MLIINFISKDVPLPLEKPEMVAIRNTEMIDFMESVLVGIVGPQYVYHFMKHCILN